MSDIFRSFRKDWWRWSPFERLGALLGLALGVAVLALVGLTA